MISVKQPMHYDTTPFLATTHLHLQHWVPFRRPSDFLFKRSVISVHEHAHVCWRHTGAAGCACTDTPCMIQTRANTMFFTHLGLRGVRLCRGRLKQAMSV